MRSMEDMLTCADDMWMAFRTRSLIFTRYHVIVDFIAFA